MAVPILNAVSPSAGPPGTAISCQGSGFDAAAQVGCPALVETTFVSAAEVTAAIPAELAGPAGGEMVVAVYVRNEDGSVSASLPFTVRFPRVNLQAFTGIDAVVGEVPGFVRGGDISDAAIGGWIRASATEIVGVLLKRGLSLDPATWQEAAQGSGLPAAELVLEEINRLGAAAQLAARVGAQFAGGTEWSLAKELSRGFERKLKALREGEYDKVFAPTSATEVTGQQVGTATLETSSGEVERAFTKKQVF